MAAPPPDVGRRGAGPAGFDDRIDGLLSSLLDGLERFERPDPDVLVGQLADGLDELDPDDLALREADAATGRYLAIQPFLDGTGGRFHGAADAAGIALLDAASTPPAGLEHPDGYGAARVDALLARLATHPTDDRRRRPPAPRLRRRRGGTGSQPPRCCCACRSRR